MMSKAHYGVALCQLKLKEFKNALKAIEGAIKLDKGDMKYYIYLKATCYKGLEEFDKAEECYYGVFKRCIEPKEIVNCLLYKECYEPGEGWNLDKKNKAIDILEGISFFKGFNSSELEQILKHMEIKVYPANTLLFLSKEEIVVILQGRITLRSYSKTLETPQIVANCEVGTILNYPIDKGMSSHPEHWIYTETPIELASFSKSSFDVTFNIILVHMAYVL